MRTIRSIIAYNVEHFMRSRQLTVEDLARLAKVSSSTIDRVLRREGSPTADALETIAYGLWVEPYQLLLDRRCANSNQQAETFRVRCADSSQQAEVFRTTDNLVRTIREPDPKPTEPDQKPTTKD